MTDAAGHARRRSCRQRCRPPLRRRPKRLPAAPAVASAAAPAPVACAHGGARARFSPPPRPRSGYRLQVGAVRSPEAVAPEWNRLKRAQADLLGQLGMQSVRADLGERGVFYRIEAGPIADQAAAAHICTELKERKVGCILVRP